MADDLLPGLGDKSLGELGTINERYKQKVRSENKAARGTGGVGTNQFDDAARKASKKQLQVEDEIFGRLSDIHESRSEYAQKQDESRKARRANSPEQWANDPNSWDWPGIDMP